GTYTQTQSDTVLTIMPDSTAFADLCFPNPTITFITTPPGQGIPVSPVPPALYHTPGKAIIAVLTADSLNIKADWIISGTSGAPDTTMHAETGFRRTSN
ncbi:MAG TPA: hypothetical protein VG890_02445, partial [Puia sp.]|nr:hypothetical protein [Puia sp.]